MLGSLAAILDQPTSWSIQVQTPVCVCVFSSGQGLSRDQQQLPPGLQGAEDQGPVRSGPLLRALQEGTENFVLCFEGVFNTILPSLTECVNEWL